MSIDPQRMALRRRPLFTPLYAGVALVIVALALAGWALAGLWHAPGTVIVVRHMEKLADAGDDPGLSPVGQRRAERVAELLAAAGVDAVFATQYRRTAETGLPLAERLSLPLHVYDARDTEQLLAEVDDTYRNGTVVVVGHSNTVPEIVEALSGEDIGAISEDRYGDVYIVTRPKLGRASVTMIFVTEQ